MTLYRRLLAALLTALLLMPAGIALAEATPADYDLNAPQDLAEGHLYAQSALLVDEDTGAVLFSKNSKVRMYPASTTKIMTLLLALESEIALDARVTIPAEAAQIPEGSSVIPVKPGDEMSFSDLLYGFMLSSGNDGANAIAVLVDGSIEAFVARMNDRAAELGCEGTHYVNAHGYHDAEHYTTAQDLVAIARVAMENADFRRIVAAPSWTMSVRRGGEDVKLEIVSRNSLLQSGEKYYYPDCTGIKTGHHSKAGWCFVGSAERDGMRVICAVLNCERENDKWYDAARLFEYGFTRYEPVTARSLLERVRERFARVQVSGASGQDPEGGSLLLELDDVEGGERTVRVVRGSEAALSAAAQRLAGAAQVTWETALAAPVAQGQRLGSLSLTLPDGSLLRASLTAPRAVEAQPAPATPVPAAPTRAAGAPDGGPGRPAGRGGANAVLLVLLIALLLAAFAAVALAIHSARRKKRRRKRRRQSRR